MLVIGGGATGVQVASIFNAFGSRVRLFQAGPRILPAEDDDVSAAVADAFRASGIAVSESFGSIESFEKTPSGVRMVFSKDGTRDSAEAALAVVAVGWVADTARAESRSRRRRRGSARLRAGRSMSPDICG
jgi:dihydrolipoamide dehydrogenase